MQPDTATTASRTYGGSNVVTERQFTDYLTDFSGTVYSGTGQLVGWLIDRPLLTGSIIVAAIGAFLGSRLGRAFAMRRRRTLYERAFENFAPVVAAIGAMASPRYRERAMGALGRAGMGRLAGAPDWGRILAGRMPAMERPQEERPGTITRIGWGLGLVPVTFALIRNPLVRDIGFRWLAGRVMPRRR